MKGTMRHFTVFCLCCMAILFGLPACGPSVPKPYIQPDKMENLLYDFHLVEGMLKINNRLSEDSMRAAVFEKHGVTEEEFDSSLVYYMRHTDKMRDIYKSLGERFAHNAAKEGVAVTNSLQYINSPDTANIWQDKNSVLLLSHIPFNYCSYELQADTTFHPGDEFVFGFDTEYVQQDGGRDATAVLAVMFANDSSIVRMQHVPTSQQVSLSVRDIKYNGVKWVKCFMYMEKPVSERISELPASLKILVAKNITLLKVHHHQEVQATLNDTVQTAPPSVAPEMEVLPNGQRPSMRPMAAKRPPMPPEAIAERPQPTKTQ